MDPSNSDPEPASWKRFFVFVCGHTGEAHLEFVQRLKHCDQTEAQSGDDCDYVLVFCPVTSRVGTDVSEALSRAPAGKPLVLVVMHHTYDHECVVAPSRRQVSDPRVRLTVDCLFYDNHFLDCQRNDDACLQISNYIRPPTTGRTDSACPNTCQDLVALCGSKTVLIAVICGAVAVYVIVVCVYLSRM